MKHQDLTIDTHLSFGVHEPGGWFQRKYEGKFTMYSTIYDFRHFWRIWVTNRVPLRLDVLASQMRALEIHGTSNCFNHVLRQSHCCRGILPHGALSIMKHTILLARAFFGIRFLSVVRRHTSVSFTPQPKKRFIEGVLNKKNRRNTSYSDSVQAVVVMKCHDWPSNRYWPRKACLLT